MTEKHPYCVALFNSVSHVMKAEKILKEAGILHKIVPVPKTISLDCGVCVRFEPELRDALLAALESKVSIREIREL
jgi:hypothetical protein